LADVKGGDLVALDLAGCDSLEKGEGEGGAAGEGVEDGGPLILG